MPWDFNLASGHGGAHTRINHGEAEQFRALERAVRAEQARKKAEERETRASAGLPPAEEPKGWLMRLLGRMAGGRKEGKIVR